MIQVSVINQAQVIFEGVKYDVGSSKDSINQLNYIVNSVIKKSNDQLASQYRNHELLFKKKSLITVAFAG